MLWREKNRDRGPTIIIKRILFDVIQMIIDDSDSISEDHADECRRKTLSLHLERIIAKLLLEAIERSQREHAGIS